MIPHGNYFANPARGYSMNTNLRSDRDTSAYDGEFRKAEVELTVPGDYGQWSLWKSTVFGGMYTARHPLHGEEWIDAPNDAAAIARFRRYVRSKGART